MEVFEGVEMKHGMKRTCNGCQFYYPPECEAGINIDVKTSCMGSAVEHKPTEPCLKPRTFSEYIEARKYYMENKK